MGMNDSDRERLQEIRKQAADTPDGREYLVLMSDVKLLTSEIERLEKVNDNLIAENKRLEAGYCGHKRVAFEVSGKTCGNCADRGTCLAHYENCIPPGNACVEWRGETDEDHENLQDALTETELLRQGLEAERDEMCAALHGRAEHGHKCKERGLTEALDKLIAELEAAKLYALETLRGAE